MVWASRSAGIFCKGSFEHVLQLCRPDSVPENFAQASDATAQVAGTVALRDFTWFQYGGFMGILDLTNQILVDIRIWVDTLRCSQTQTWQWKQKQISMSFPAKRSPFLGEIVAGDPNLLQKTRRKPGKNVLSKMNSESLLEFLWKGKCAIISTKL